jgi:hypothetical protein
MSGWNEWHHAELVVAAGDTGPVAEFLEDGESGPAALFGLGVVSAAPGDDAELVGEAGGGVGLGR